VPIGKVVSLETLYNFGLYKVFPPRAVTMGCYNVLTKTYFNRIMVRLSRTKCLYPAITSRIVMLFLKQFIVRRRVNFPSPSPSIKMDLGLFLSPTLQKSHKLSEDSDWERKQSQYSNGKYNRLLLGRLV